MAQAAEQTKHQIVWQRGMLFLARGCGSGRLHPAPGTWGSLAAALIGVLWGFLGGMPLLFILAAGLAGIYICDSGEKQLGIHDAPEIVFDEWVGMWIAMWRVPLVLVPVAFLLFRLFDISKLSIIGKIQELPGGLGIMADDVLAGLCGRLVLAGLMLLLALL